MTLIRWNNPWTLSSMMDEMMRNDARETNGNRCGCGPATNIMEKEDSFVIEMAVPGFRKDEININFEDDTLTISSEKEDNEKENTEFTRKEFAYGGFSRSFSIPESVNAEDIKAEYNNGILSIILPKKEEEKKMNKEIAIA
ncbi:MAG: Hsp20/alpha crystallin family protein [Bacteroidales bacterium]|nr:Hsp20/alpha crystallin family protein [Bacteroidales bacterium]